MPSIYTDTGGDIAPWQALPGATTSVLGANENPGFFGTEIGRAATLEILVFGATRQGSSCEADESVFLVVNSVNGNKAFAMIAQNGNWMVMEMARVSSTLPEDFIGSGFSRMTPVSWNDAPTYAYDPGEPCDLNSFDPEFTLTPTDPVSPGTVLTASFNQAAYPNNGANLTFVYEWARQYPDGGGYEIIEGASGPQYTITGADIGNSIFVDLVIYNGNSERARWA